VCLFVFRDFRLFRLSLWYDEPIAPQNQKTVSRPTTRFFRHLPTASLYHPLINHLTNAQNVIADRLDFADRLWQLITSSLDPTTPKLSNPDPDLSTPRPGLLVGQAKRARSIDSVIAPRPPIKSQCGYLSRGARPLPAMRPLP